MSKTRLQAARRTSRIVRFFLGGAVVGFCALSALACGDGGIAPLPPGDGPLTGKWIQPSIDTWIQLDLSQSGTRVVGYHRNGSANFGGSLSNPVWVTGVAALPDVTLRWSENGEQWTMEATLSPDGDSLTGKWNTSSQPPRSFFRFQRSAK